MEIDKFNWLLSVVIGCMAVWWCWIKKSIFFSICILCLWHSHLTEVFVGTFFTFTFYYIVKQNMGKVLITQPKAVEIN